VAPGVIENFSAAGFAGLDSGPAAGLAAAFLWAFTSILFTAAGRNVVPAATNLFKTVAATVLFAVALTLRDGLPFDASLAPREVLLLALSGIAGLALGDSFLFAGYQILGTRRAMLVQSTHPIIGTLLAVFFFGEWPTFLQFLGIVVVLVGLGLVLGDRAQRRFLPPARRRRGIVLGLLAAMGQATGALLAKEALVGSDAFGATQIRVAGGALGLVVFALLRGELGDWIRGLLQPAVLWRVSAASVLGPFLAVFLMLYSIQHAPAGVALTLLATAPVWLLPLGAVFQGDHPTRQEIFGVVLAVGGIAVLLR
jgi:drug/metabolite transporter (DMT)-like permease